MVLSTEWSQVEAIDLENDGSGFGFGIVGGRSTGVVIKSILPGGIADRDSRLRSGDHVLQVGDVAARGLGCEHVAGLLRASGARVRLIVARPAEPGAGGTIIETCVLAEPDGLTTLLEAVPDCDPVSTSPVPIEEDDFDEETECDEVELRKDARGLGITVAGYVWEREELSGLFVKGISEGGAAALSGRVQLNDRIVTVNGTSLRGLTNHQAVEMLRRAGDSVTLGLERYLRGPCYDHLQDALRTAGGPPSPPSPSVATSLSWFPVDAGDEIEAESATIVSETDDVEIFVDTHFESPDATTPDADEAVRRRWQAAVGQNGEVVVARLRKLRGLGISLEGTVEVEDGVERRPRHFIRSILPEGPVGRCGTLSSGDELLEVNGQRLLGRDHVEVVRILRELPETVRIVCARGGGGSRVIDTAPDRRAFASRSLLAGSLAALGLSPRNSTGEVVVDVAYDLDETLERRRNESPTREVLVHEHADLEDFIEDDMSDELTSTDINPSIICHCGNESSSMTISPKEIMVTDITIDGECSNDFNSKDMNDNKSFVNEINHKEDLILDTIDSNPESESCKSNTFNSNEHDVRNTNSNETDNIVVESMITNAIDSNITANINENIPRRVDSNDFNHIMPNSYESDSSLIDSSMGSNRLERELVEKRCDEKMAVIREPEPVTYLAVWADEIEIIELQKGPRGLGFSILDYQDPKNPNGTVIVVRSLVTRGAAAVDGRLRPGDRLISVGSTDLRNVSLDVAAKALRSVPLGPVRLGVAKPLPPPCAGGGALTDDCFIW